MSQRIDHVQAAMDEAHKHGASFDWERGKKNIVGFIFFNGQQRKLFMSATPSDHRASLNIRKNVRDYIKEMGG